MSDERLPEYVLDAVDEAVKTDFPRRSALDALFAAIERYKNDAVIGLTKLYSAQLEELKRLQGNRISALESHQRWVAVSERLPTESCYCNVGYGPGRLRWAIAWCSVIEGEPTEFNDEAGDNITDQVYAWVAVPPLGDLPARSEGQS